MFSWLKELLDLRFEYKARTARLEADNKNNEINIEHNTVKCESCETLKMQLAIANQEKGKLLERLLEKPEPEIERAESNKIPLNKGPMLMSARRTMLEAESRNQASLIAERNRKDTAERVSLERLESEMGIKTGEANATK